jgi:VWFA-related protein
MHGRAIVARIAITLLIVFLIVVPSATGIVAHAQQPMFRTATRLIVQSVTVNDKSGKPVPGLTATDFIVTEDGVPQEISFVEYQALATAPAGAITATADTGATAPITAGASAPPKVESVTSSTAIVDDPKYRDRRLLIFYFDLYQMPFFQQMRALENADRYITAHMTPSDLVAVMVFEGRGVRMRQDFTGDRVALRQVLNAMMVAADEKDKGLPAEFDPGGAFGEDDDTFNIFGTDRQLSALQTAVTDLGPLPELKTLIYFGGGLQMSGTDNLAQLRATVNAAVRSSVTINPIDTRGLEATAPMGNATQASRGGIGMFSGTIAQAQTTRAQRSQDTLYAIAKDTGGKALFDNNDLSLGIKAAAQAVTGYYMIGYYSTHADADGKYRRIKVSLANDLAGDLSYRAGYYGDKPYAKFNDADRERQLAEALKLEDPITEIPMAAEVNFFQLSRAEYFVPVSVRMPGSELAQAKSNGASQIEIDVIGEIKDSYGATIRNMRDKVKVSIPRSDADRVASRLIQYEAGFTVLPGSYVIKLLARNTTTGRIGTFQTSFVVPNLEREHTRLPTSSVVLTSQRIASTETLFTVKQKIDANIANPLVFDGQRLVPSATRTFSAARPLFVFLEAYEHGAVGMRPLVAYVTFFRDGAKVLETTPERVSDGWDPKVNAVPIRLGVSIATMTPGPYDCQVTVLDPDGGTAAFWRSEVRVIK